MEMLLQASFVLGTDIRAAAEQAIAFGRKHDVGVEWKFNGVELFAWKHTNAEEIVQMYHRKLGGKHEQG